MWRGRSGMCHVIIGRATIAANNKGVDNVRAPPLDRALISTLSPSMRGVSRNPDSIREFDFLPVQSYHTIRKISGWTFLKRPTFINDSLRSTIQRANEALFGLCKPVGAVFSSISQ